MFQRILADVSGNRTGLPDLIQLWPEERRYRMIEVKGPGDRLQDNQKRWIDYAHQHGLPIAVCHVQWAEVVAWAIGSRCAHSASSPPRLARWEKRRVGERCV